jgi:MFS family permease
VAVSGAPSVEREFALSHAAYVGLVFAVPLLVAAVLEGAIALLSEVWERRRLVVAGQGVLAASLCLAAWTKSAWGLTIGLALAGAASGVACGAAQALLVVANPRDTDRVLVRWALFASIGDFLTPLITAGAIASGSSYRGAMTAIAVVVAAQCVGTARVLSGGHAEFPADNRDDSPALSEPLRSALARALRRPRLWAWLFAAASCALLDELVVALAALRLTREQGVDEAFAAAAVAAFAAGSVLGSALTDRAVGRFGRRRVLLASAVLCAIALVPEAHARTAAPSCIALFAIGVLAAPHHALAMAQAYDVVPGNPGTVQAMGQLFVLVDILSPLAFGLIADRYGLGEAMTWLVLQPVVIVVCTAMSRGERLTKRSGRSKRFSS